MEPLFSPRSSDLPIRNLRLKLPEGQIFWREVGRGSILVCLHGAWSDGNQWLPLMAQLSRDYHCLAPDLLGWGESSRVRPAAYSIDLEVEALANLLKALRIHSVHFVGHSIGAWVAAAYALKYPDQVQNLILLEPEGVETLALVGRWREHQYLVSPLAALWLPLSKLFSRSADRRKGWLRSHHLRQKLLAYPAACRLLFRRRRPAIQAELLSSEVLNRLTVPLLLVQGEPSQGLSQQLCQAYLASCPNAELKIVAEDEEFLGNSPVTLAEAIRTFIEPVKRTQPSWQRWGT